MFCSEGTCFESRPEASSVHPQSIAGKFQEITTVTTRLISSTIHPIRFSANCSNIRRYIFREVQKFYRKEAKKNHPLYFLLLSVILDLMPSRTSRFVGEGGSKYFVYIFKTPCASNQHVAKSLFFYTAL
jgi:hypothetical protein